MKRVSAGISFAEGKTVFLVKDREAIGDDDGAGLAWDEDARGAVGGNADRPGELVAGEFPVAEDFTVERAIGRAGVREACGDIGAEREVLEAGLFRIEFNAGNVAEQPFADGAERIVVQGIHMRIEEAVVLRPTVPAFPDRGSAVLNGIEPRGIVVAQEKFVSDVGGR